MAITIVAVGLVIGIPVARQRGAILKVEALGGMITSSQPIGPDWLREWMGEERMQYVDRVEGLWFRTSQKEFEARFSGTYLGRSPITAGPTVDDESLACVAAFPHLKFINLSWGKISGKGLAHLASLRELEELRVRGTDIGDESLVILAGLTSLQELDLVDTKMSREKVDELRRALPDCNIQNQSIWDQSESNNEQLLELIEELKLGKPSEGSGMGGGMF